MPKAVADVVLSVRSSDPSAPADGTLWYNITTGKFKFRENGVTNTFAVTGHVHSAADITSGTLPIARGGTGATSFTAGRVLFAGASAISEDSGLHWDNTNKRLGIGTTGPQTTLDIRLPKAGWALRFGLDDAESYGYLSARAVKNEVGLMGWGNDVIAVREHAKYHYGAYIITVDSTTGNAGIGTMDPEAKLHIVGRAGAGSDISQMNLDSTMSTGSYNRIKIGHSLATYNAADIQFYYAGNGSPSNYFGIGFHGASDRLVVRADGNVGIGTTRPGNKLGITITTNDVIPPLGSNGGSFGLFKSDGGTPGNYGFIMGVLGNGNVFQQAQRIDGTAVAYNLLLNPSGGNVSIGGTTNPQAKLDIEGSIAVGVVSVTSSYTITATATSVVLANASGGAITVTLPSAFITGMIVHITKIDNSANVVTVSRAGTDSIEGATSVSLAFQYRRLTLVAGGNGVWYRLASNV